MEYKSQTDSVLAKLMCLERPLPIKLIQNGRKRVFSEKYFQDITLICQQQKRSFDRFSMGADVRTEEDNLFRKLWLLNPSQNSGRKVKYAKKMQSVSQNDMTSDPRTRGNCLGKREIDCVRGGEVLRYGSMEGDEIGKQVCNELKNSVWHDCLKEVRPDEIKGKADVGHEQCLSNIMSFKSSGSSKFRNKRFNVHNDWGLNLVSEGSSYCKISQNVKCNSEEETIPKNSVVITSLHSEMDVSFESGEAQQPREVSTCSDTGSLSSENEECMNIGPILEEVVDDAFMALHPADNESPPYQMEAHKPNPDSTSNFKDTSSAAHFIPTHGSEIKLQQSTSTFFHPEAKRHRRIDVKDAKQETISGIFKTEETQIMSYLIDILAELGVHCGNLEKCFQLGQQSLENPMNPFVFDSLEKKYSTQPSWVKSDRKLLFDRIKCTLSEILYSSACHKYRKSRLLLHCSQDIIREELLSVLVNQEKDAKRVSSDKAVGIDYNWLELDEDIQIVVKEIEENMMDELIEEIIRSELLI